MSKNYYSILGISKGASGDDIKKAYRKLAHQFHPDKQGGDEAKFKELNEAYQVLSDHQKRSQYDQFGSAFNSNGGFGGTGGGNPFGGFDFSQGFGGFGGQEFNMEDIFDLFGGGFGQRAGPRQGGAGRGGKEVSKGEDIRISMTIDVHDMARGATKRIEFSKDIICEECTGTGVKRGSEPITCPECKGAGQVRESVRSIFGNFSRATVCDNCLGTGKVPKEKCHTCKGDGRHKGKKVFEFNIPAGIQDGETLIIKGAGQAGFRGGRSGDLYIVISVASDRTFTRLGNDLIYKLSVKLTDALLGAKIRVPTLDGDREIEISPGAQEGDEVRLKGMGVHGSRKGDQVVKIKVDIPKKLSGKARKLVEELRAEI